jgi:hypothetical protein
MSITGMSPTRAKTSTPRVLRRITRRSTADSFARFIGREKGIKGPCGVWQYRSFSASPACFPEGRLNREERDACSRPLL